MSLTSEPCVGMELSTFQQSARRSTEIFRMALNFKLVLLVAYRDADKSLHRPGRKQCFCQNGVYFLRHVALREPGGSVGIGMATGWAVRGSNHVGGEIFRTRPDRPWCPVSLLYNGYRVFPGGKKRSRLDADPSPPSSAVIKKEWSYISTPPTGRTACTELQCLYKGAFYLYLYLYSPYGPYSLYRTSLPVQGCTLPLPIPLLPLWTVQHVQSLIACTRLHFTFTYTSTPPMDRTACTEPQCLYNAALYLHLTLPYLLRGGSGERLHAAGFDHTLELAGSDP